MKKLDFVLLSLFLATTACHPSYQKLLAYDAARELRDAKIVLVLDGHQSEAATFKSYGYTRVAERRARTDARTAERFDEALQGFDFCRIERVWKDDLDRLPVSENGFFLTVEQVCEQQGEQSKMVWSLVLRPADGGALPGPFPQEQVIGESLSKSSLRYAFRSLDARMEKLWRMAMDDTNGNPGRYQ